MADVAQFAMVQRARAKAALSSGTLEQLEGHGGGGKPLYDVPGGLPPAEDMPAPPRLMATLHSTLLAYSDRSRVISPDYHTEHPRDRKAAGQSLATDESACTPGIVSG